MSDSHRNFWSTIPGVVTGLAGLLTGIVGLLTVSVQLGWLGGDSKAAKEGSTTTSSTMSTVPDGDTTTTYRSGGGTASGSRFELTPTTLTFSVVGRSERTLTVTNAGATPFSIVSAQVEGPGAAQFQVDDTDCVSADLAPRDHCDLVVSYTQGGGTGPATVEVMVSGSDRPQSAELKTSLL